MVAMFLKTNAMCVDLRKDLMLTMTITVVLGYVLEREVVPDKLAGNV